LYGRPVGALVPERAVNTALLAVAALALATLIGLPLGIVTGSRPGALSNGIRALSLVLLSMPPLITSLVLVLLAARTGWFPIGGMTSVDAASARSASDLLWHLALPALALALPIAAMFERLQAQAMTDTLAQPFVAAARARGVPERRLVWRDALRVAIRPCASVYGLVIGTLLSGSFIVEIITAWPGLGRLMYDALRARDVFLVAGCAAAGAIFLAIGSMVSDLALALADPRVRE
jgi:peptide/nickel transport system permease protein